MFGRKSLLGGLLLIASAAVAMAQQEQPQQPPQQAPAMLNMTPPAPLATAMTKLPTVYDFPVKPMESDKHSSPTLAQYKGKVLMILNVASKCGNTPQYEKLEKMSKEYKDKGLVIIGFPCNQFGGQEPGTESEILEFCKSTYDVDFPLYAKIDVNGPNRSPLYKYLCTEASSETGDITWNFEKFIIGRDGLVVSRFPPKTQPDDPAVLKALNFALSRPAPAN
jgi:glutathione peroxidase